MSTSVHKPVTFTIFLATTQCCNQNTCLYVNNVGYNSSKNSCESFGGELVNVIQWIKNCSGKYVFVYTYLSNQMA